MLRYLYMGLKTLLVWLTVFGLGNGGFAPFADTDILTDKITPAGDTSLYLQIDAEDEGWDTYAPGRIYGGCRPADRTVDGLRLLFLDTCYFKSGARYTPAGGDWRDCFLPEEGAFLASLAESEAPAAVFLHHNIDPAVPADHRLYNADALFAGINRSKKVPAVFQGHYHPGMRSRYGDVRYVTLPAVCENENAFFVVDTNEIIRRGSAGILLT